MKWGSAKVGRPISWPRLGPGVTQAPIKQEEAQASRRRFTAHERPQVYDLRADTQGEEASGKAESVCRKTASAHGLEKCRQHGIAIAPVSRRQVLNRKLKIANCRMPCSQPPVCNLLFAICSSQLAVPPSRLPCASNRPSRPRPQPRPRRPHLHDDARRLRRRRSEGGTAWCR